MNDAIDTPSEKECPFCAEIIKAKAKKCRYCGEFMPGYNRKEILGDDIDIGNVTDAHGVAVGRQSQAAIAGEGSTLLQSQGDITLGKSERDEQYAIALNWDEKTKMREFDLSKRDLTKVHLRGAHLHRANLSEANLSEAKLSGADLSGATLYRANLHHAKLDGASLNGAHLHHAKLNGATLYKANLWEAYLNGADLSGANLSEAGLLTARLGECTYNDKTIWPHGFDPSRITPAQSQRLKSQELIWPTKKWPGR